MSLSSCSKKCQGSSSWLIQVFGFLNTGKNALDIAKVFADSRIIDLLQEKLENLPEEPEKKEAEKVKVVKPKSPSTPMPSEVPAVKTEV